MHKFALAAALVVALSAPAFAAAAEYYVALDTSTNKCRVMSTKPDGMKQKMVGSGAYETMAQAQNAIQSLTECNS
jgi:hypothetical protein